MDKSFDHLEVADVPKDQCEGTKIVDENTSEENSPVTSPAPPASTAPAAECNSDPSPVRISNLQYLQQTAVPILVQGLGAIGIENPENPIEFLGNYFLSQKDRHQSNVQSKI